jgi:hypothetical protein
MNKASPSGVEDHLSYKHVVNMATDTVEMSPLYEGTIIRMFKPKGKTYLSTNRKLDCSKSRWGSNRNFFELLKDLWPEMDSFEINEGSSYSFVLCHPELLISSKVPLMDKSGLLLCISDPPLPGFNVVDIKTVPDKAYQAKPYRFDNHYDASEFLSNGYELTDTKFDGEALIVTVRDKASGLIKDMFKVYSPGYSRRLTIRGTHPNLDFQFHCLYNASYNIPKQFIHYERFMDRFDHVRPINSNEMNAEFENNFHRYGAEFLSAEFLSSVFHKPSDPQIFMQKLNSSRDYRLRVIFTCFIMSLPYWRQYDVSDCVEAFYDECAKLCEWINNDKPEKYNQLVGCNINTMLQQNGIFIYRAFRDMQYAKSN